MTVPPVWRDGAAGYPVYGWNDPAMAMMPYLVTILAVAGFAGQIRGPAAVGKPYIKG